MSRLAVLNVVGLSGGLINPTDTPFIAELSAKQGRRPLLVPFPAVTCSAQTTLLTGVLPNEHGIVGNGWYFKELNEIWFWRQSNKLVQAKPVWAEAKNKQGSFKCANSFWWYNMASSADIAVTPRPLYPADGRKIPDCHTQPLSLRHKLTERLGTFPLFHFWGPTASIKSSRWIAEAAKYIEENETPDLQLIYLPHLDYCLQKYGPDHAASKKELRVVDELVRELWDYFTRRGLDLILHSEYAISKVNHVVYPNRELRGLGLLAVKDELGLETLDTFESKAFAVCDHQCAHIYVNDKKEISRIREHFQGLAGVEKVLSGQDLKEAGLDHERAGDIVLMSSSESWMCYYFWVDDAKAPDYARTVDIHKKPGYDPVELFINPKDFLVKARLIFKILGRKLGFRNLLDIIPLDASLVQGSHGRPPDHPEKGPILISSKKKGTSTSEPLKATDFKKEVLDHLGSSNPPL